MFNKLTHNDEPKGIRGWLLLVALQLAAYPLVAVYNLKLPISIWLSPTPLSFYSALAQIVFWSTLWSSIGTCVFSIVLNVLFYKKSRAFPKYMIGFYTATILLGFFNAVFMHKLELDGAESSFARIVLASTIWIFYILKSKRVKNTFIM
jgi:hypothetical protein